MPHLRPRLAIIAIAAALLLCGCPPPPNAPPTTPVAMLGRIPLLVSPAPSAALLKKLADASPYPASAFTAAFHPTAARSCSQVAGTSKAGATAQAAPIPNGLTELQVSVADQAGKEVSGLKQSDFSVAESGKLKKIEFFRGEHNAPASIGIVIDTSGSSATSLLAIQSAAATFVTRLDPRDDVFLAAFNSRLYLLAAPTTDHAKILAKLTLLRSYGETALYDALDESLGVIARGCYPDRALVVFSDGDDNASAVSAIKAIDDARAANVRIFTVGVGSPASISPAMQIVPFAAFPEGSVDARRLQELADKTAGQAFIVNTSSGQSQAAVGGLNRSLGELAASLNRSYYVLGIHENHPHDLRVVMVYRNDLKIDWRIIRPSSLRPRPAAPHPKRVRLRRP